MSLAQWAIHDAPSVRVVVFGAGFSVSQTLARSRSRRGYAAASSVLWWFPIVARTRRTLCEPRLPTTTAAPARRGCQELLDAGLKRSAIESSIEHQRHQGCVTAQRTDKGEPLGTRVQNTAHAAHLARVWPRNNAILSIAQVSPSNTGHTVCQRSPNFG